MGGIGVLSLVVIGVVVVAAALFAVLHFRFGLFGGGKSRGRRRSPLLDESRVEVLESTDVDGDRRLVLVRCDRIEHLIMVGGPVDLVVENDVKKVRGPGTPAPKSAGGGLTDILGGGAAPATEHQPFERPAAERPAPAAAERRALAAPRSSQEPAAPSRAEDTRRRTQPQHTDESPLSRREGAQQQRRTIQPRPLGGPRPEPTRHEPERDRPASHGRGKENAAPLPAAGTPWTEPDSIENEIVQALRFDPVPRAGGKAAPPPQAPAAEKDETGSTTLGDLADRLEEALAQEVQSASHSSSTPALDLDSDEFGFGGERPAGRSNPSSSQAAARKDEPRSRSTRSELPRAPEPRKSSPEPERRRDASASERRRDTSASSSSERGDRVERTERREEAPVISLNARRRESADALEDEMARLLGELTGDTKGR